MAGAGGSSGSAGSAGTGGGASFDLVFEGSGFTPHDGEVLRVALVSTTGSTVLGEDTQVVSGGAFRFAWPGVLMEGSDYHLDYVADHNASGACDAPSADHVWSEPIAAVSSNTTVSVTHNTNFVDVCSSFSTPAHALSFSGSGFGPHEGQTLSMALVRTDTEAVVARDSATVTGGAFSFAWSGLLLDGVGYRLDYYADLNGNGQCDPPSNDHAWRVDLGTVTADVAEQVAHNTNFTDVCASFP